MFKRGSIVMTIWNLIVAAGLIALGIASCVNRENQDFQNVMFLIAGIFVIVDASLRLLTQVIQIVRFDKGLVMKTSIASAVTGASELAIGIMLILVSQNQADMDIVIRYLIYFVAILLMAIGTVAIIYAIIFLVKKAASVPSNIIGIIVGALLITAGVLVLVFVSSDQFVAFLFVLAGIIFILAGVGLIFGSIGLALAAHQAKKVSEEENPAPAEEPVAEAVIEEAPAEEEPKEEPAEEKPEEPSEPAEEEKPSDKPE